MSEIQIESETKAPAKRKAKKSKASAKPAAVQPVKDGPFAGITAKFCPSACTAEKCVISTVGVCHHPFKTAPNGAGPITMANREKARKLIKHQMVDATG